MAFIKIISPGQATEAVKKEYQTASQLSDSSLIPKIVQIFSVKPASMQSMLRKFELTMWMGTVSRENRELVAAVVSRFNECHY